jgi:hypothetical protein
MGWSCTACASEVERSWSEVCYKQTGLQNGYDVAGDRLFYDVGREQYDGAITGQVFSMTTGRKVGTFRIEPDGKVSRWPKGLRPIVEAGLVR